MGGNVMGSASDMVKKARSYLGKNYVHFCETMAGKGAGFDWCASFISTLAIETDNVGAIPKSTSCTSQMNWFKSNGRWVSKGNKPKIGYIQYYDWDNSGDADHVGLVVSVSGDSVTTIEGNVGNGGWASTTVKSVTYKINMGNIAGWGSPAYGTTGTLDNGFIGPLTAEQAGIDVTAQGLLTESDYGYTPDFDVYASLESDSQKYSINTLREIDKISALRGIIGIPPQFLSTTDLRMGYKSKDYFSDERLGTDYVKSIASKMPLVYISPCEPVFLPKLTGSDRKKGLTKYIQALSMDKDESNVALESLLEDYSGKIYSVQYAYEKYFNYINPACRAMAMFLELESSKYSSVLGGMSPYSYNWGYNYVNFEEMDSGSNAMLGGNTESLKFSDKLSNMQEIAYHRGSIPFYVNTETQVSREFSNRTTESSLASSINAMSDQARELQYVLGLTSSQVGLNFDKLKSELSGDLTSLTSFVNSLPIGGNLFSTILGGINTMVAGGRLIFPELWSDSESSESYTINTKLIAPDPDDFSIWLYVLCPLIHIWGLVSPRQADYNGYNAPFLVKAFCKGLFNIDMGIITNCSITLGKENTWNKSGLPTVVEVSMTIQNLYNKLAMTDMTNMKYGMMNNIAEMDFLANLCGINYNVPDSVRYVKMFAQLNYQSQIKDKVSNIPIKFNNWLDNKLLNFSNAFQGM